MRALIFFDFNRKTKAAGQIALLVLLSPPLALFAVPPNWIVFLLHMLRVDAQKNAELSYLSFLIMQKKPNQAWIRCCHLRVH
jgi:hypothetical protein